MYQFMEPNILKKIAKKKQTKNIRETPSHSVRALDGSEN